MSSFRVLLLISALFTTVCILGFLYQIETVCTMYFRYETTSLVKIGIMSEQDWPQLAICVPYRQVIQEDESENLTVWELFNKTLPVEFLISSCSVRRGMNDGH